VAREGLLKSGPRRRIKITNWSGRGPLAQLLFPPHHVPRLPSASWTLADPRGRPYFVFWTSPHDGTLTRVLRMESVQQGAAVQLTIPSK
jgi:hypothetical protein